jgi:hypothetical protein
MEFLANSLESRETYTNNLENCATSKQMLQAVLQRDSIKDEPGMEPIPPFDHVRCTDCSYTRAITSDCIDHLTALHNQAMTASKRLQHLVEAREQMRDLAESMELSDGSKLGVDDSAIGAVEGTGDASYRSLPSYISPRSNPSSPNIIVADPARRVSADREANADIDRLVVTSSPSNGKHKKGHHHHHHHHHHHSSAADTGDASPLTGTPERAKDDDANGSKESSPAEV